MMKQLAIGIDIGGMTIQYGFVNHRGGILHRGQALPASNFASAEEFVETLFNTLHPTIEKVRSENIKGIGISAPNGGVQTGSIEAAPQLPWKGVVPLAEMVRERFSMPCTLTNAAHAAAMGELRYGAARGMQDFIVLSLGTRVGSAIVSNGQLVCGHGGFAGALGHTVVRRGRKHWATGLDGSLEAFVSATGIALTARVLLDSCVGPSLLRQYQAEAIDAELVGVCALQGDALARKVFAYTGKVLGEALANFVMFSAPQAVILLGGVTKAGDLLLRPSREHMEQQLLPIFQNKVQLLCSGLTEAEAALLGASALVWASKGEEAELLSEAVPIY